MSKIIEGLKYSESHEWVKVEGNVAVIGVSADQAFTGNVTEQSIEDYVDTLSTITYEEYRSRNQDPLSLREDQGPQRRSDRYGGR